MAALQEQMELLRTNQVNAKLPWSLATLVWDDSNSVGLTTVKAGYSSPMADPAKMLDPDAKEFHASNGSIT
jgi:hypothetical protein